MKKETRGFLCLRLRMSSGGVILNGGTAESFTLGSTVEGLNQDPSEDRVAYDAWEPEDLVATVQFLATLDDRLLLPSPVDKVNQQDRLESSDEEQQQEENHHVLNANSIMDATSSSVEEVESTLLVDISAVALSDITTEENSVSSAAQTPCSTEERSIIRASNKPAHLKRYWPFILIILHVVLLSNSTT